MQFKEKSTQEIVRMDLCFLPVWHADSCSSDGRASPRNRKDVSFTKEPDPQHSLNIKTMDGVAVGISLLAS